MTAFETFKNVCACIATTPQLWPPLVLLGVVVTVFILEVATGVAIIQDKHVTYCNAIADNVGVWNASRDIIPPMCYDVVKP